MDQFGLVGDATGTELPQAMPNDDAKNELRKKAKYSRSKEFQELKAHMEVRIEFYQKFLPNGEPVATQKDPAQHWKLANIIIAELQQVIDMYENANEMLKEIDA